MDDLIMRRLAMRPWIRFSDAGGAGGGTGTGTGENQPGDEGGDDKGFPPNTRIADMTPEQQAAYWKHQARKHETRANAAADYETIKAERDQLRQERMTEDEKALADAEARGREAAEGEWRPRVVRASLTAGLAGRGMKPEDIDEELSLIDPQAFLTDKGEVDTDKVTKFLDRRSPAQQERPGSSPFGLGTTERIQTSGREAGQAEAAKRFGTKK